ncbi:pilus assembly protein FimV [Neisseriaceae bacterium TC5R-5]|nr:pilus assembly protein FimV [Neisseriaceae bacterium TC5R-5]
MVAKSRLRCVGALLLGMAFTPWASAGLGSIKVLSAEGETFRAEIPVLDEATSGNVLANLADRNRYPSLSSYSGSVASLQFVPIFQADGSLQKVLVTGPASFPESLLRFAVEIRWPAGRMVREFDVDYQRDGPRKPAPLPHDRDGDKKAILHSDSSPRLDHLGFGELKVLSRLGEPVHLELALFGAALDTDKPPQVRVLALADEQQPSAQQQQLLASMALQWDKLASGKWLLHLRTPDALEDPKLAFRLQIMAGALKVEKDYRIVFDASALAQVSASSVGDKHEPESSWRSYRVLPGDTLSGLAQRVRGAASREQAAAQLFASNSEAFIQGDVNRLRAGAVLHYPAQWRLMPRRLPSRVVHTAAPRPASINNQQQRLAQTLLQQDEALRQAEQRAQELADKLANLQSQPAPAASQPYTATIPLRSPLHSASSAKAVQAKQKQPASLLDSPLVYLPLTAGAIALVAGGGWWWRRRKHKAQSNIIAQHHAEAPMTALGEVLNKSEGLEVVPADPMAQADVYVAYGRYEQALSILREALLADPMRQDLRYKLLEVLAAQQDKAAFIAEATATKQRFGPDSTLWQQVCELGRRLDQSNILFSPDAVAASQPEAVAAASSLTEEAQKEELVKLYREMGDNEAAETLLKESG